MAEPVTAAELRDLLYLIVSAYSALDGAHTDCDPERAHECHLRLRAHIESAMAALSNSEHSKPALSEVEKAAVNVVNAYHGCGEGAYDAHSLPDAVFTLRDALKRIGAL